MSEIAAPKTPAQPDVIIKQIGGFGALAHRAVYAADEKVGQALDMQDRGGLEVPPQMQSGVVSEENLLVRAPYYGSDRQTGYRDYVDENELRGAINFAMRVGDNERAEEILAVYDRVLGEVAPSSLRSPALAQIRLDVAAAPYAGRLRDSLAETQPWFHFHKDLDGEGVIVRKAPQTLWQRLSGEYNRRVVTPGDVGTIARRVDAVTHYDDFESVAGSPSISKLVQELDDLFLKIEKFVADNHFRSIEQGNEFVAAAEQLRNALRKYPTSRLPAA